MKPERLQKIDQVFESALEIAPENRARFLDEACAGDPELRREVESLLNAHEKAGDFIEDSASDVAAQLLVTHSMGNFFFSQGRTTKPLTDCKKRSISTRIFG